jgi:hypothetical protein
MSKKRVITTYMIDRKEIEDAVLIALKKKHPELNKDELEARLVFYYSDGKGFGPQARLDASLEFVEEIEVGNEVLH